jgi:hypothetical protein
MLDAYVMDGTTRKLVYCQHVQFVQDYQFWGHWAHKRVDAQGHIYYLSPEVILGNARGRAVAPARLRRVFRLRQLTREVRQQSQIRLHNFGLYVDHGLSGQTVEVLIYDEAMRIRAGGAPSGGLSLCLRHQAAPDHRRGWHRPAALLSGAGNPADALGPGARTYRLAHATVSPGSMGSPDAARTANAPV